MPYITTDSMGVREYLSSNSAIFLKEPSAGAIVSAILELKQEGIRQEYSNKINLNYLEFASQKILSEKFEQTLLKLLSFKGNRSN